MFLDLSRLKLIREGKTVIKIYCHNCKKYHTVKLELKTEDGIACEILAYSDIEFTLKCECGTELMIID